MSQFYYYCPVCAWVNGLEETEGTRCKFCFEGTITKSPNDLFYYMDLAESRGMERKHSSLVLREDIIYPNPQFNPALARESDVKQDADIRKHLDSIPTPNKPKCPTCNSTDIQKISTASRAVSVGFWGLFSGKLGKTMECNKCGYKW